MTAKDAAWGVVTGLTWLETDLNLVDLSATLDERGGIDVDYVASTGESGTLSLAAYDTLYQRGSSLEMLAGTYTTQNASWAIDDQGAIFVQHGSCAGNGRAAVIDPEFNMYRFEVEIESCAGSTVHAPGRTFTGLAFLRDSDVGLGPGGILEFALCSASDGGMVFWGQTIWR
jgi:hypothetical protein